MYRERLDARYTANLTVASAVRVIHGYHDQPPAIEAVQAELEPTAKLLTANIQEAVSKADDEGNT